MILTYYNKIELADKFNIAIVFVLSQDPKNLYGDWENKVRKLETEQYKNPEFKPFKDNKVNWDGFIAWCKYFTICKTIGSNDYFDFAPIIKSFIKNQYANKCRIEIHHFLQDLSKFIPFFQNGEYWNNCRKKMSNIYDYPDNELNAYTSLALFKLDQENVIKINPKSSDSQNIVFFTKGYNTKLKNNNGDIFEVSEIEIL